MHCICDFQTAVVPHVSLDIHHADFGQLLDPKAVEQKVTEIINCFVIFLLSKISESVNCTKKNYR